MLTALYDLSQSPLTFDFAYAVVQGELMRRLGDHDLLRFHIRNIIGSGQQDAYATDEGSWRLRHIIVPLAGLLPQPAEINIDASLPEGDNVFSRPHGLHWLSDLVRLAEEGHEIRLLEASKNDRSRIAARLDLQVQGRKIITVTLRETRYARARNSDLQAWASLCRQIPRDRFAVVVLRDHERVEERLPGDWGEVILAPEAVWSLRLRMALYEAAWLNLGVNNGPMALTILSRHARFVIFKMLCQTPETSRQHFRRLGLEPGADFPFLGPEQRIVWEQDDIDILRRNILPILEEGHFPQDRISGRPAATCLLEAARRDYRWGLPAASAIERIGPGPERSAAAIEWATMLLDEGRPQDAARSLTEAPPSPARDALGSTIGAALGQMEPSVVMDDTRSPIDLAPSVDLPPPVLLDYLGGEECQRRSKSSLRGFRLTVTQNPAAPFKPRHSFRRSARLPIGSRHKPPLWIRWKSLSIRRSHWHGFRLVPKCF